ncbi:MAG: BON domain-containing protein [Terriglobales bacterium]
MRTKITAASIALLLALGMTVACSKTGSNDAQIIGQIATKIQADGNLQTKAIAIQSNNGVVTLSGQVASDAERNAAAVDAAQVEGVKTVVNNLTVANAAAVPAPVPQPTPEAQARPEPVKSSARHRSDSSRSHKSADNDRPVIPAASNTVAQNTPAPSPVSTYTPPPAPPKPQVVTIPDGTQISIRLIDPLDSEKNQVGDRFRATLGHSIYVGDQVAVPVGADVEGRVVDVKGATHFSGKSVLAVELTNLSMGGKNYELHTQEFRREGAARGKNTAEKVGGGAALGAIIGAIAGGGKGAAIGATVGAGAGGGVNAATKGQKIQLPVESVLNFQLASPLTVTPAKQADHSYNDRPVLTDRSNNGNNNNYNDNRDYSDNDSTDRPVLERRPAPNSNGGDNNNQPN